MQAHARNTVTAAVAAIIVFAGKVVGQSNSSDSGSGEGYGGNNSEGGISELISELTDFTGSWDATLEEVLYAVIFEPFKLMAQQLLGVLVTLLTTAPRVQPNPAVAEIHRLTFTVTLMLAGLGLMVIGILYIAGPVFGVAYSEVRKAIPRLLIALTFAAVAPHLLQLAVDGSNALVQAFRPSQLSMSVTQMAGLSVTLGVIVVTEAVVLLAVVLMFMIRNAYILFVTAISPLIALAWAIPPTRKYAEPFIGGFWTALAMGPLCVLILRLNLALLNGSGGTVLQSISNWVYGIAGFSLMILVPLQLYGASSAIVGQAYVVASGLKKTAKKGVRKYRRSREDSDDSMGNGRRTVKAGDIYYRPERDSHFGRDRGRESVQAEDVSPGQHGEEGGSERPELSLEHFGRKSVEAESESDIIWRGSDAAENDQRELSHNGHSDSSGEQDNDRDTSDAEDSDDVHAMQSQVQKTMKEDHSSNDNKLIYREEDDDE